VSRREAQEKRGDSSTREESREKRCRGPAHMSVAGDRCDGVFPAKARRTACFSLWTFARSRARPTPEHGRTLARASCHFPTKAPTFGPTRAGDGAAVAIGVRYALPRGGRARNAERPGADPRAVRRLPQPPPLSREIRECAPAQTSTRAGARPYCGGGGRSKRRTLAERREYNRAGREEGDSPRVR